MQGCEAESCPGDDDACFMCACAEAVLLLSLDCVWVRGGALGYDSNIALVPERQLSHHDGPSTTFDMSSMQATPLTPQLHLHPCTGIHAPKVMHPMSPFAVHAFSASLSAREV